MRFMQLYYSVSVLLSAVTSNDVANFKKIGRKRKGLKGIKFLHI